MKRQDIISKLINEGFTQKTLVNLNDKQLHMLAERVLSEQYALTTTTTGAATPSVLNIPKEKTQDITSAKTRKQTFATYEGEMKEEEKLGAEKKEKNESEKVLQRIHSKAEAKMKKGECIKSEVELLKRMKKDVPEKYTKYIEAKKEKVKEKEPEPVSENKKVNKWVNKLVENKCFTSKGDIINLIQSKLDEQKTAPQPAKPEKEVETDPDRVAPDYDPDTDNPFKVQPGIKIEPKASKSSTEPETKSIEEPNMSSAENAKNKIIDLMIKNL
jgi:hypothetical protein